MQGSPFRNTMDAVDAQQGKIKVKRKTSIWYGRKQENDRNVAPARIAFNLGLAFDRNRVVEELGFSSDGSAGCLWACRRKLGCCGGSGAVRSAVRSDCGAASVFE